MRVIHSRKYIYDDSFITDANLLLVWFVSCVLWKYYGYDPVLYTDLHTYELLKEYDIDDLYTEINTKYFEKDSTFRNIDLYHFWASPKLLSLEYELCQLKNKAFAADTDVIPFNNLWRFWNNANIVVWSLCEYRELQAIYPPKEYVSTPANYTYPSWVQYNAQPMNTGIMYFRRIEDAHNYLTAVRQFITNNKNPKNNNTTQSMCVAEQLFLGNYIFNNHIQYTCIQPLNEGICNRNALHTHSYKRILSIQHDKIGWLWDIDLLLILKRYNLPYYNKIINKPLFKQAARFLEKAGDYWISVPELNQYRKLLNMEDVKIWSDEVLNTLLATEGGQ